MVIPGPPRTSAASRAETAGTVMTAAATSSHRSDGHDELRLEAGPDDAVAIRQLCLGHPRSLPSHRRDGVQQQPFAYRIPLQDNGQVDVKELKPARVKCHADATARISQKHGPSHWRQQLSVDQRYAGPTPRLARTGLREAASQEPPVDRG